MIDIKKSKSKIHTIIQNEIASEVWYESRGCEDTLRKCLIKAEKKLKELFTNQQKDLLESVKKEINQMDAEIWMCAKDRSKSKKLVNVKDLTQVIDKAIKEI